MKVNKLKKGQCPLINIKTGKVVNRSVLKPSVDTPTHLEIYKNFKNIKSISHCHSMYATAWAQASRPIPLLGTTHADFWKNDIPVVKYLKKKEMKKYELYTGKLICKKIKDEKINIDTCPGLLVSGHGQFSWGNDYVKAVINSNLIEYIASMAYASIKIGIREAGHLTDFKLLLFTTMSPTFSPYSVLMFISFILAFIFGRFSHLYLLC